jgi:hypothetical protein
LGDSEGEGEVFEEELVVVRGDVGGGLEMLNSGRSTVFTKG